VAQHNAAEDKYRKRFSLVDNVGLQSQRMDIFQINGYNCWISHKLGTNFLTASPGRRGELLTYKQARSQVLGFRGTKYIFRGRGASRGSVWLSWQIPLHRRYSALKPIKYQALSL